MRLQTSGAVLVDLGINIMIVPDRVIDGEEPVYRQADQLVPTPPWVTANATCPAAGPFWEELP